VAKDFAIHRTRRPVWQCSTSHVSLDTVQHDSGYNRTGDFAVSDEHKRRNAISQVYQMTNPASTGLGHEAFRFPRASKNQICGAKVGLQEAVQAKAC